MNQTNQTRRPSHDEIALLAYRLWETSGRQDGRDVELWLLAESQLCASAADPTAQPAAKIAQTKNDPAARPLRGGSKPRKQQAAS